MWAAHAERGTKPPEFYDGEWFSDEAFSNVLNRKRPEISIDHLRFPLAAGDFEFSFDFQELTGEKVHICSNASLLRSLQNLTKHIWHVARRSC